MRDCSVEDALQGFQVHRCKPVCIEPESGAEYCGGCCLGAKYAFKSCIVEVVFDIGCPRSGLEEGSPRKADGRGRVQVRRRRPETAHRSWLGLQRGVLVSHEVGLVGFDVPSSLVRTYSLRGNLWQENASVVRRIGLGQQRHVFMVHWQSEVAIIRASMLSTSVDGTASVRRGSPRQGTLVESAEAFSSGSEARMTHLPRRSHHRARIRGGVRALVMCALCCANFANVFCVRSPWPTSPRNATFAVRISSTNLCTLPSRSGLTGFGKGKTPSFSSGAPNRLSITSDCTTPDEAQKTAAATSLHHSKKAPQLPGPSRQALTRKTAG